jgi:hypothetical protein
MPSYKTVLHGHSGNRFFRNCLRFEKSSALRFTDLSVNQLQDNVVKALNLQDTGEVRKRLSPAKELTMLFVQFTVERVEMDQRCEGEISNSCSPFHSPENLHFDTKLNLFSQLQMTCSLADPTLEQLSKL